MNSSRCSRKCLLPLILPVRALLQAIARFLNLSSDFFEDTVRDGNSVMRLIHYPPVPENSPAVRAAAHEDINTITLLIGAEEAGLELLDKQGSWRR